MHSSRGDAMLAKTSQPIEIASWYDLLRYKPEEC